MGLKVGLGGLRPQSIRLATGLHAHADGAEESGDVDDNGGGDGGSDGDIRPALSLYTFDVPRQSDTSTYEVLVKAETGCDEGGRNRLVRWHLSGPGTAPNTVAAEAVVYDPHFLEAEGGAGVSAEMGARAREGTREDAAKTGSGAAALTAEEVTAGSAEMVARANGAMEQWADKILGPVEASDIIMGDGDVLLLDCRTFEEYR